MGVSSVFIFQGVMHVLIPLANWLIHTAVGLKALGYGYKGRLHGLNNTRYRISPAVSRFCSGRLKPRLMRPWRVVHLRGRRVCSVPSP